MIMHVEQVKRIKQILHAFFSKTVHFCDIRLRIQINAKKFQKILQLKKL